MELFCSRIEKTNFAVLMYLMGVVQFGSFRLKLHRSGWPDMDESPYFVNFRIEEDGGPLTSDQARFVGQQLGYWYQDNVPIMDPNSRFIAGIPRAGTLLAEGFQSVMPEIVLAKMNKEGGKESEIKASIEGNIVPKSLGLVVDDVATDGGSKIEVDERIRGCGFGVDRFIIVVDRGGVSELREKRYNIEAMYGLPELMGIYRERKIISTDQHTRILGYDAYVKEYKASHPPVAA